MIGKAHRLDHYISNKSYELLLMIVGFNEHLDHYIANKLYRTSTYDCRFK